jgi:hypothetical protein
MIALPDDKGFVEIMTDRGASSRGERRGQRTGNTRIIAYFYQPDCTTRINPAPTDVKIKIGAADSGSLISLSQDPKEAGKFESDPGTIPDGFRGQIDFQSDGKPVHATFLFR